MRTELIEVYDQVRQDPPDCSIVVPVYNGVRFLRESLVSVIGQTGIVCEILISDDGSDDGSLEEVLAIIRPYAGPHSIRVYRTSAPAIVDNMPLLVHASRTDCIIQAHQDDVSDPDRAFTLRRRLKGRAKLVTSVARTRKAGVVSGPSAATMAKLRAGTTFKGLVENGQGVISGARYAMHRDLFQLFPPLSGEHLSHGHDVLLYVRAKMLGACKIIRRPIITIGDHPGRGSRQLFDRQDAATRGFDFALRRLVILSVALRDLAHVVATGAITAERAERIGARLAAMRAAYLDALVANREAAIGRGFRLAWTKLPSDPRQRSLPL